MKISRNSWHYRLYTKLGIWKPTNLCMYVQKLFWTIAAITAVTPTVLIGLVSFPTLIYLQITLGIYGEELWAHFGIGNGLAVYIVLTFMVGMIAYAILTFVAVGITYELYKDKRRERLYAMTQSERDALQLEDLQPGLLISWWRAIHDKVCPMIEFVNKS